MDCSLPGSSVHGILQARILEWVAIPFSGGFSQPRNQTWVFVLQVEFFIIWATTQCSVEQGIFKVKGVTAMIVLVKKMSTKRMEPSYPY